MSKDDRQHGRSHDGRGEGTPEEERSMDEGIERDEDDVTGDEILAHEHALPDDEAGDLEPDVEILHRAIVREPRDPLEGREPAPWWVWASAAVALFWGGWYLGRHGGDFDTEVHTAYVSRVPTVTEEADEMAAATVLDPVTEGARIYAGTCQSCHQADGAGLSGAFPPIVGSEWVTGDPETLVRIIVHGVQGPIRVAGEDFDGVMPGWGDELTDEEIAAVATYIRQWDINDASPVDAETVEGVREADAARTEPWTMDDLEAAPPAAGPETEEAEEP